MNEICNSFIKRSYERLAWTKILYRLYTIFLTGFSLFLKQNCWVWAWIFAFFPPSFTSTTSELSSNVFILNSKDFLSHEICWFWSRNSCLCMDAMCPHFSRAQEAYLCYVGALHALRKDSNIVISKPDKGNGVVVLNRADYVEKIYHVTFGKGSWSQASLPNWQGGLGLCSATDLSLLCFLSLLHACKGLVNRLLPSLVLPHGEVNGTTDTWSTLLDSCPLWKETQLGMTSPAKITYCPAKHP